MRERDRQNVREEGGIVKEMKKKKEKIEKNHERNNEQD